MDTKIYRCWNSHIYKWYCTQHEYLSEKWGTILLKHDGHDEDLHHEQNKNDNNKDDGHNWVLNSC